MLLSRFVGVMFAAIPESVQDGWRALVSAAIQPRLTAWRLFCLTTLWIAASLVASTPALGQSLPPTTADDQMGFQPFNSYHGGDSDHIGLANGTLTLDYPFLSYSQRGQLHLDFHLYYTNQPQHSAQFCVPNSSPQKCYFLWGFVPVASPLPLEKGAAFVGWAQQMSFYYTDSVVNEGSNYHYSNWSIQMADGSKHPLGNLGNITWRGSPPDVYEVNGGPFASLDATAWRLNGSLATDDYGQGPPSVSSIVSPDGTVGATQDANGNVIGTTVNSAGMATAFTDTLGRQIPAPPTASSASNTGTSNCPTGALTVNHAVLWSVPGPSGGTSNFTFCYAIVTINRPPLTGSPYQGISTQTVLQSIVLPDGHSWSFQYNDPGDGSTYNNTAVNYGTLTQMTLPTGGTISYTYTTTGVGGPACQTPGRYVASRTVNANDGTGNHTWNYAYATASNGNNQWSVTTTVTDPLNNQTVHTFNSLYQLDYCPAYEAQTQYYQGSQSSGTLVKTVNTTYSYTAGDNKNGPLNVVPTKITTTWATTGLTTTVNKSYDAGFTYNNFFGGSGTGIYGKELSESASDYAKSNPPTIKTTNTSYLAFSNSSYLTANLLNLVSSKSVSDGNNCKKAETDYTYDESSYLTTYGGTLPAGTHGAPPNSVRGNPTTVTQQLFASGSCPTGTQSGPTTHTSWYDTGEVYQATDALGNTTTHSYDSFYAGAYSTKTTNALSQTVSGTYDFNTGLLTSFTDANGSYQASGNTPGDAAHTTTLQYNDPMWRLTQVQSPPDPGGNHPVTTIKYPDANTVERLKTTTTSLTDDSYGYFDGVGRHYKSVHASANNATAVTTYDADGRTASVTNPYFSTNDPTYGVTQTQYDGIGRVTKTTKQDNSLVTAQYNQTSANSPNGDCTVTTDEAGNPRQVCNDGMGRLIEVDEPGNAFAGTNASGSITVNGTLQSTQVLVQQGTSGSGSFTIQGKEGSWVAPPCEPPPHENICTTYYDSGPLTVTVDGFTAQFTYTAGSTTSSVATQLAKNLSASGSPVTATASGSTVTMTAIAQGSNTDYSWSSTSKSNHFPTSSFTFSPTSGALSGGQNAVYNTVYDAGTVSLSVGGFTTPTVQYGQSSNSTSSQVASALASALNNASGAPATATASGSTINITYSTVGTAGNVSVNCNASTSQGQYFPGPSFTCPGSSLSGGQNSYPSGLAHPYVTLYTYDTLGNLLSVNQKGDGSQAARQRNFTYDSLSRLLTATNPESGQISYSYDANGNMLQKTSLAPNQTGSSTQTISYCYDTLNRVTGKAYSAQTCQSGQLPSGTAVVSYTYDGGTNGIGHLTSLSDQAGSGSYNYDALGRITSEQRTIAGIQKTLSYTYNLDNSVATLTYPSGAVVTYTPDAAGRALSAVDSANNINYVTSATYGPDSSLTGFVSGNSTSFAGITNSWQYNPRLQICRITALTTGSVPTSCTDGSHTGNVLDLGYSMNLGNGDNGNVIGTTNYKDSTRSQSFTYDTLNRLTSAQNAGTNCNQMTVNGKTEYWGNSYGYDAFGNLLSKAPTRCSPENLSVSVLANNQLVGYSYDAAGNMTHDSTTNLNYTFDAENRITGAAGYTYTYDADGNRVEKSNGSTGTIYWYMTPGIVAESDLNGNLKSEYVFFDGDRIARRDFPGNAVSYYFSDHLRTASVITNSAGTITEDEDYYPWGGELQLVNGDSNHYKFTGKERDAESGLDYFGARHYGNWLGRFVVPDEPFADQDKKDPQSWNLYSYVRNSPVAFSDPTGEDRRVCDAKGNNCMNVPEDQWQQFLKDNNLIESGNNLYYKNPPGYLPVLAGSQSYYNPDDLKGYAHLALASRVTDKYIAFPLLTFLSSGTAGILQGPQIVNATLSILRTLTTVIGKLSDLKDGVRPGEKTLDLPNQGSPKANWAQNSSKLRSAMHEGNPIRDASVNNPKGETGLLRAEREMLRDHGWQLRGEYWYPPGK